MPFLRLKTGLFQLQQEFFLGGAFHKGVVHRHSFTGGVDKAAYLGAGCQIRIHSHAHMVFAVQGADAVILGGAPAACDKTIEGVEEILSGKCDDIPEQYFLMCGTIDEVYAKAEQGA